MSHSDEDPIEVAVEDADADDESGALWSASSAKRPSKRNSHSVRFAGGLDVLEVDVLDELPKPLPKSMQSGFSLDRPPSTNAPSAYSAGTNRITFPDYDVSNHQTDDDSDVSSDGTQNDSATPTQEMELAQIRSSSLSPIDRSSKMRARYAAKTEKSVSFLLPDLKSVSFLLPGSRSAISPEPGTMPSSLGFDAMISNVKAVDKEKEKKDARKKEKRGSPKPAPRELLIPLFSPKEAAERIKMEWSPTWTTNYQICSSRSNHAKHKSCRFYFDAIPNSLAGDISTREKTQPLDEFMASGTHAQMKQVQDAMAKSGIAVPKKGIFRSQIPVVKYPSRTVVQVQRPSGPQPETRIRRRSSGMAPREFTLWIQSTFGSSVEAWRSLDTSCAMRVTYPQMKEWLVAYKYTGNRMDVLRLLSRTNSSHLEYFFFDPLGALEVLNFKDWAERNGISLASVATGRRAGLRELIEREEPAKQCQLKDGMRTLQALAPTVREATLLEKWVAPDYLVAEPCEEDAMLWRRTVKMAVDKRWDRKKTPTSGMKSWFAIDSDRGMRVGWEEFRAMSNFLKIDKKVAANAFAYVDRDYSGFISASEWDKDVYERLLRFKKAATALSGSVRDFVGVGLSRTGFINKITDMRIPDGKGSTRSVSTRFGALELFESLAHNPKRLMSGDVICLDKWNPEKDEMEEKIWAEMIQSHRLIRSDNERRMSP